MLNPSNLHSFSSNHYIYVDPDAEITQDSIMLIRLNNENLAFRQLFVDQDGKTMFKAINPEWPEEPFEAKRDTEIYGVIIGKTLP
jgi:SOS-response transcriptional repressor LexA